MRKGNARFGKRDMGYVQTLNSLVLGLFANGEPGFWLDPSDFSTMFQDSAGTTPVTAVEQPVGLILDKSKGLALGADVVTNGNFTSDTAWAKDAGWTISGGAANSAGNVNATLSQAGMTLGKSYKLQFTVVSGSGNLRIYFGSGDTTPTINVSAGTYTVYGVAIGDAAIYFQNSVSAPTFSGSITAVSLKQVLGFPFRQSTAGVRPVLSARVNLLTKTEAITDAIYAKTRCTVAAIDGADGSIGTAGRITATSANGTFQQNVTASITPKTSVIYLRRNTGTGGVSLIKADGSYQAVTLTSSWVAYSCTGTSGGATSQQGILIVTSGDVVDYWHPDLRDADQATGLIPTYQRVNTSTDYDTAGFPLCLSGNGTQWMQCAAQDYTGVNKMLVVPGFRVNSAADVYVVELSANVASNNGSYAIEAGGNDFYLPLRGALFSRLYSAGAAIPPQTMVLSMAYDLAAATAATQIKPRKNGATLSTVLFNESTAGGNFGNYPVYLFCRGGTTAFLPGNIYQLIARGSTVASSAAQISAAESWTDLKTRAY